MDWGFDYMQRQGPSAPEPRTWLPDGAGGAVYLRLSTRPVEQIQSPRDEAFRQGVTDGAYWMRKPGPNAEVVIVYQGAVATAAIEAAGRIGNDRRDIGVLAVTSADRLHAGWASAGRARAQGIETARSHIESLLENLPAHCLLVTVVDGHPATLSWLGGVSGHRVAALGVDHFGQSGTIGDLHRHFKVDAQAIVSAACANSYGRPLSLRVG